MYQAASDEHGAFLKLANWVLSPESTLVSFWMAEPSHLFFYKLVFLSFRVMV